MTMATLRELMNNTFAGEITEGKHECILTNFKYVENETNPDNSYITITLELDGKREYKKNLFLRDVSIMLSHTRRQLNRANEDIVPGVYLKELIDNKVKLNIWFEYPVVATRTGARRVQNISWLPPVQELGNATPDFEMPPM